MESKIRALWAKKNEEGTWLPLVSHIHDTAEVAKILWDTWVSNVIKDRIEQDLTNGVSGRNLYVFLACVHDIGKASPAFQFREDWRTPNVDKVLMMNLTDVGFSGSKHRTSIRHEFITHCILDRFGFDSSVSVVVGGHHGRQPELSDLYKVKEELKSLVGFKSADWLDAQQEVLSVALDVSELTLDELKQAKLTKPSQILLSGLVIMADWMASSEKHFPLIATHRYAVAISKERAERALQSYKLPYSPCIWGCFQGSNEM